MAEHQCCLALCCRCMLPVHSRGLYALVGCGIPMIGPHNLSNYRDLDRRRCYFRLRLQGEDIQKMSLEVYQTMAAAASPSDLARVLPLLEKLLCHAGLMRATWAEHWQHSWQRATSYCVDWKHALLLTASLQVRAPASSSANVKAYPEKAYLETASS